MPARASSLLTWLSGIGVSLFLMFVAGPAAAQCCAPPTPPNPCNCTPPPCCTPPTPPPPPTTNCCTPSHDVTIPGVNVFVAPSVNVSVRASANASAGASAGAGGMVFVGGGGGGGGYAGPGAVGVIQGLDVQGAQRTRRVAYEAKRTRYLKIVVQAFCLDDLNVPHPASQVTPDRELEEGYDGEVYRCIAGTRMQYTWVEWRGQQIDFSGGHTITCAKGEALYRSMGAAGLAGGPDGAQGPGGPAAQMACRPQKPARDCNERSLLRRYGAGVKVFSILIVETYTAYREEVIKEASSSTAMSLDGGVGGIVY